MPKTVKLKMSIGALVTVG